MGIFPDIFTEMAVLLLFAALVGALGAHFHQPLIVAFIAVGILAGPSVLGWVSADDEVDLLAKLGISLLLFVVGLKLDLHIIRTMGPVALTVGLGQILITGILGYLIALALGMASIPALYVAVALSFSSTIIIVKLLSDRREVDTLYGRITLGILIVQDLVVVLAMISLHALASAHSGALASPEATSAAHQFLNVLLKGTAFLAVVALAMRYVLPPLLHLLSRSQELLVLFGIAWAVALSATGDMLGFSKEVGAFIAGVSLASTPYRDVLGARLVSLRDFLLVFFFLDLGAGLNLGLLGAQIKPALLFSIFVLIGKPLIVLSIMGLLGYRRRTSFLSGLTLAQISEFSLILAALGHSLGHIDDETTGLITLVGLLTISASSYMIIYSHPFYDRLARFLRIFERRHPAREADQPIPIEDSVPQVILFGVGRYGVGIAHVLRERGCHVRTVSYDPQQVRTGDPMGYPVLYGDAEDPEFISTLPLDRTQWVVSTVRDNRVSQILIHSLKHHGYAGHIAVTAARIAEVAALEHLGADIVLLPFTDAVHDAADRLLGQVSPNLP